MRIEDIDARLEWMLDRKRNWRDQRGNNMQDQFTIEIRVDFEDKGKIEEVQKLVCSMARTLVANVQLLGPACKPDCVIYSDNFMSPPEKLDLYADLIGKGNQELAAIAEKTGEEVVSAEMLAAMKG
jgi:hypothetical protein